MDRLKSYFIFLCLLAFCGVAQAEPLEITADKVLEWHRDQQKIIARGHAKASQGESSLSADLMTATYLEGEKENKFLPKTLIAEKHVVIQTADGKAYGDKAVYDIKNKTATLTGTDLKMISKNMVLTAQDRFEYQIELGKLSAIGRAKMVQATDKGDNTIEADTLSASFQKNSDKNKRELERMDATGNVIITTPTEIIKGDEGFFNKITNIAELSGNVSVVRGQNVLEGDLATVDLNTNISTLSGSKTEDGRVRGVFYPE